MLEQDQLYRSSATAIGFSAIVLWASLAWLTVMSGQIPPFELTAITFTIAAGLGFVIALSRGRGKLLWPRFSVLCLGVGGLFGDYVLYFGALRLAPPLQAGLIVALWPLMMVVLSAVVLRETLRINHALGAMLGLAGVLVLTLDTHTALLFDMNYLLGYLLAFGAAVVWAGYSVLSRCYADVPTEAVTSFCFVAALLAAVGHFGWEQTLVPSRRQAGPSHYWFGLRAGRSVVLRMGLRHQARQHPNTWHSKQCRSGYVDHPACRNWCRPSQAKPWHRLHAHCCCSRSRDYEAATDQDRDGVHDHKTALKFGRPLTCSAGRVELVGAR